MKIQELRDLLSKTERGLLEKAFSESYKKFSKAQKEEVDQIIMGILEGKDLPGKKVNSQEPKNFDALEEEINIFIENAYAQNYLVPNRVIPKSQRPKWRFLVNGYIKALLKIPTDSEYYTRMVKLLTDLYKMICVACNTYLFSTEDPFRSIGWDQTDLFGCVVKKTFEQGYSREDISALIVMASTGGLSRESLHMGQQFALLGELKTADVKYMAIEETMKLVEGRETALKKLKKHSSERYYIESAIDSFCEMLLMTAIALGEPDDAVKYCFNNFKERDKEIVLYRILELIDIMEEDDLWIKVYELGLKKKIEPRDNLAAAYKNRCLQQQK